MDALLPGFILAAAVAEFAAATALNKFQVLGHFDLNDPLFGNAGHLRHTRRKKVILGESDRERRFVRRCAGTLPPIYFVVGRLSFEIDILAKSSRLWVSSRTGSRVRPGYYV